MEHTLAWGSTSLGEEAMEALAAPQVGKHFGSFARGPEQRLSHLQQIVVPHLQNGAPSKAAGESDPLASGEPISTRSLRFHYLRVIRLMGPFVVISAVIICF